jgi:hypothetical protein
MAESCKHMGRLVARGVHLALKGLAIMGVFVAVEFSGAYFAEDT